MSGLGSFFTKSIKEAAEDLVKSKLSGFKSGDKKDSDNMNQPSHPPGQPQYGGYQGSQNNGGYQPYGGGGYGQPQSGGMPPSYGMNPQVSGGYGGPGATGAPGGYGASGGYGGPGAPGGMGAPGGYGGSSAMSSSGSYGASGGMGAPGGMGGGMPIPANYVAGGGMGGGMPMPGNYGASASMGGGMPMHGQGFMPSQYSGQMPQNTVPMMLGNPSIKPSQNFNPSIDAEVLRKAMKGIGCNNTRVIDVICKRTNFERLQIARSFQQMYGKDLIHELKSELYGDFEDLIIGLMTPSPQYDATEIHRAIAGLGTNENILIEIMCSRTNAQIFQIKSAYKYLYNTDLESDLKGDTSGYFKRLLVALSTGYRDESNYTDINNAHQSAKTLYSAGEGRLGTDESTFLSVLCSQNFSQLKLVFQEYHKLTGRTIDIAIKNEFSGDIKDALLALYHVVVNRPGFFASQLENSMKGFGTRDKDLIRLVVSRCEIDMFDIRNEFQKMYGRSLEDTIAGDTSGSYKNALITLVKGN